MWFGLDHGSIFYLELCSTTVIQLVDGLIQRFVSWRRFTSPWNCVMSRAGIVVSEGMRWDEDKLDRDPCGTTDNNNAKTDKPSRESAPDEIHTHK